MYIRVPFHFNQIRELEGDGPPIWTYLTNIRKAKDRGYLLGLQSSYMGFVGSGR